MRHIKEFNKNIGRERVPPLFKVGDIVYSKNKVRGLKENQPYKIEQVNNNIYNQYTYKLFGHLISYKESNLISKKDYKEQQLKNDAEKYNL